MNHTKEPWILRQGTEIGVADTSDTQSYGMLNVIARVDKYDFENWQENARRIVACVNACAGVSTETLEKFGGRAITAESERDAYSDLCAELIVALKDAQNTLANCKAEIGYKHRQTDTAIKINSAITKAEKLIGENNVHT